MSNWNYTHLEMVARDGDMGKLIDVMDNADVDRRLVEILSEANENVNGMSYDELCEKNDRLTDELDLHKQVTDFTNDVLPNLLHNLVYDLIEAKGVKYKSKNALLYFLNQLECSEIGGDAQELVEKLFESLHNQVSKL